MPAKSIAVQVRDGFRVAYHDLLLAHGWLKRPRTERLFYRTANGNYTIVIGWNSFNLSESGFYLDVAIMLKPYTITEIAARCWNRAHDPLGHVSLTHSLAYLVPNGATPLYTVSASRDLKEQALDVLNMLAVYGVPYILCYCSLESYLEGLYETEGWPSGIEQIPIVLFLLGRADEANAYMERQLERRRAHPRHYVYPCTLAQYEQYVDALRKYMAEHGSAAEIVGSDPDSPG